MNTRTRFHRDGTVASWNIYTQSWQRRMEPGAVSPHVLAALPAKERERILRRAARERDEDR